MDVHLTNGTHDDDDGHSDDENGDERVGDDDCDDALMHAVVLRLLRPQGKTVVVGGGA